MTTPYDVFRFRNITQDSVFALPPLVIPYYDLTMVVSGTMSYWVDNEPIKLQAGDVMLLPPTTNRRRIAGSNACHYIYFNFYTNVQIELPKVMRDAFSPELQSLFQAYRVPFYLRGDPGSGKVSYILGYALDTLLESEYKAKQNVHIQKAMDYVDEHITEPLSLSHIAAHLCLTREYTAALFKKELGSTVSAFVNKKKMLLASNLLQADEKNLPKLASYLGYENYGYFSRIFKKHFGISPLQYKKSIPPD